MLFQCSSRSSAALFKPSRVLQATRKAHAAPSIRTYTTLPSLRPTIFSSPIRRSIAQNTAHLSPTTTTASAAPTSCAHLSLDLLPKISSHLALGSTQVRCGPRNTFSPSHFVRKRRHGFLSRLRTRKGRATLLRRKLKRRSTLSH